MASKRTKGTSRKTTRKRQVRMTAHHTEPADCKHPIGSRIGDTCALCGLTVKR